MLTKSPRPLLAAFFLAAMMVFSVCSHAQEARKAKTEVKPVFPELAKRMNLSTTVKVQVEIAPNGTVTSAKALGGHPLFLESATEAVKKWRFEPAPAATSQVIEFKFNNAAN